MPDFRHRSTQKELLDRADIPFADIRSNMQELDIINSRLGGHAITLHGIKAFLRKEGQNAILHVVEIGCGGGDNLRAIKNWAEKNNRSIHFTGIDINPECVAFAKQQKANRDIEFLCSDYRDAIFSQPADLIFSSLFCHHFTNEEMVLQMQWMKKNSRLGFFINDLHRHPIAYNSIKFLTQLFSKSYLVKNDAPLSVLRGFKQRELKLLLQKAGISNAHIYWRWAFRWLVIFKR
ncbi:MAG: methyltransferase protein [Flaviaesturariibacter sp.]|nr:methyltransferase protein [Flaviaesturariibacter sp.]